MLALALSRLTDISNAHCQWNSSMTQVHGQFKRQAISMSWDFAEAHPFAEGAAGNFMTTLSTMIEVLERSGELRGDATVNRHSATAHALPDDSADAFYVWLKRSVPGRYSAMFADELIPKDAECVVDEAKNKDRAFFERTMTQALAEGRRVVRPGGIAVVVFAHKSTAGWEAQIEAMLRAGWVITASWPIDTERENRTRALNSAALASSVHLVCRPRENADGSLRTDAVGDWCDVLTELPKRIHEWLPRLMKEGIVGADAIFACLGPALEIFSQYSRVEDAAGNEIKLKVYLEKVWEVVAREALTQIFSGANTAGFEPDARLSAMWLWTLFSGSLDHGKGDEEGDDEDDENEAGSAKTPKAGGFALEYDAARKIAQGLGANLEELTGLVEVKGETARLLSVAERARVLFGQAGEGSEAKGKKKAPKGQMALPGLGSEEEAPPSPRGAALRELGAATASATVLDRVHQAMILFSQNRGAALKRLLVDDGVGRDDRFWRLADALNRLYPQGSSERRLVEGVLSKKKGLGFG